MQHITTCESADSRMFMHIYDCSKTETSVTKL